MLREEAVAIAELACIKVSRHDQWVVRCVGKSIDQPCFVLLFVQGTDDVGGGGDEVGLAF